MTLSPDDVRREMQANGMTTASLFKQIPTPAGVIDPQQLANEEAIARAKARGAATADPVSETKPAPTPSKEIAPTFFDEAPTDVQQATQTTAEVPADAETEEPDVTNPGAEHFKRLREAHKELKKTKKELEIQLKDRDERLQKYVPAETLIDRDARIEQLTKYEKIHNLKTSKEYQEKYIAPLNAEHGKLKELLTSYGVPEDSADSVAREATSLNNHADINAFITDHFNDALGQSEAKTAILRIKGIEKEARAAEAEPIKVLESLQQSSQALADQREAQRREHISITAKSAWEEIVSEIQRKGEITELIPREDDPEFNENYPYKYMKQAATQYGQLITEMARTGATPTKEVAKALAKMTALSQVAGVSIITRDRAIQRADEIVKNADRNAGFYRPGSNGGAGSHAPADEGQKRPIAPEEQLRSDIGGVLNTVLGRK